MASKIDTYLLSLWATKFSVTLTNFVAQSQVQNFINTFVGILFTQTSTVTIANSSTPTSLIGTGTGSATLPANFLAVGRTVRVTVSGIFSTLITPGNITVAAKIGSTTIATTTITNVLASSTNQYFECAIDITCRTAGASGTIMCNGKILYEATGSVGGIAGLNNTGSTSTIDTTATQLVDIVFTWASASASNTISAINATIESLG